MLEAQAGPFLGAVSQCALPACGSSGPPRPGPCSAPVWLSAPILSGSICCGASPSRSCRRGPRRIPTSRRPRKCPSMTMPAMCSSSIAASCASGTERFDDAIADLKAAIELKPKAYQAYVNLAQAYRRLDKLDLALEQLNRAVELEPGLAHLYRLRARLYLERNEPALALGDFDQAIERENTNSPYQVDDHVERGRLLLARREVRRSAGARSTRPWRCKRTIRSASACGRRPCSGWAVSRKSSRRSTATWRRASRSSRSIAAAAWRGPSWASIRAPSKISPRRSSCTRPRPCRRIGAGRTWSWTRRSWPCATSSWPSSSIPRTATPTTAGASCAPAWAATARPIQDAAEALRLGPPSPRLLYNAARIYAQCPGPDPQRALELIQQALSLLPAEERRAFWSTHIRTDAALAALRRHPSFVRLDAELSRREVIHACSTASCGLARSTASPVVVLAAGRRLARTPHPACRLAPGARPCRCTSALFDDAQVSHFLSIPDEVDLYSVALQSGDTLDASIDAQQAGSGLTSLLRVFDANGTPLALDNQQGGDPQLTFQAATAGIYYIGVSSAPNNNYNPTVAGSGIAGRHDGAVYPGRAAHDRGAAAAGLDRQLVPDGRGHGRRRRHGPGQLHRPEPRRRRPRQLPGPGAAGRQQSLRQLLAGAGDVHEGGAGGGRDGPGLLVAGRLQRDAAGGPAVGAGVPRPAHRRRPGGARGRLVRQERRPSRLGLGAADGRHAASPPARPTCRRSMPVCSRKSRARCRPEPGAAPSRSRSAAPWATAS